MDPKHRISMIAAIGADRGLGYQGKLLFKIDEDMRFFQTKTTGHPVIMGRKTWESIPTTHRPLSKRTNIVITRDPDYHAEGAVVSTNLDAAIETAKLAPGSDEIFVIGGGEIYKAALPLADRVYLTLVNQEKPADSFFPKEYEDYFTQVVHRIPMTTESGIDCTFLVLDRDPLIPR